MKARTLGYIVAACAPVWLLALIAILGRSYYSPYFEKEFDAESTSAIQAYALPLRYTQLNASGLSALDPKTIDEVTARWIKNFKSGYLRSIEPLDAEDDDLQGFRLEIESHRRMVIVALTRDLENNIKSNDLNQAAHRICQILVISEVSKFNGPQVASFGSSAQLHALQRFDRLRPNLSPENLSKVFEAIQTLNPDPEKIRSTAVKLSVFNNATPDEDHAILPSPDQVKMMLTSNPQNYDIAGRVNSKGIIVAESYRVAYQEELKVQEKIQFYRLTALRTNSEEKSGLQ